MLDDSDSADWALDCLDAATVPVSGATDDGVVVRLLSSERDQVQLAVIASADFLASTREALEPALRAVFDGASWSIATLQLGHHTALRVSVSAEDGSAIAPKGVDVERLQRLMSETTHSWGTSFTAAAVDRGLPENVVSHYERATPPEFRRQTSPAQALDDVVALEALDGDALGVDFRVEPPAAGRQTFTLYTASGAARLSSVLPIIDGLGIDVLDEHPFDVVRRDGTPGRIYRFGILLPRNWHGNLGGDSDLAQRLTEAFDAIWRGVVEDDRLNALVIEAGLTIRQVSLLRAYVRYLRQTPSTSTPQRVEEVLRVNPSLSAGLVSLFETLHDPQHGDDAVRHSQATATSNALLAAIDEVAELDADRILRALTALVQATMRTTYFLTDAAGEPDPCIALKFDPRDIDFLPQPRPRYETFVYSPRVEGVHLRLRAIARGGLRWSDRREDFRTEILGLVKAQAVKNSVIVPAGAKGGFVVKRPPTPTDDPGRDRDRLQQEGIACYRLFVSALLRLTDNLETGTGQVLPAPGIVRRDGDDHYLVVAADKGTATFSDIANEVALEHNYWLRDAFASGGSVGYDHKVMGITARGAWASVQRHFRELGVDVDAEEFTAVGIGDMSGDVFGNGMLLSPHIALVAAFDHRHIFIDPTPDVPASFAERSRLYARPRSSWNDYDRTLISLGGGIFDRTAKSIPITAAIRRALDIDDSIEQLAPTELMRAILRAPVGLLWNGGIGTYVKATSETNAAAGDKTNDALRVDAATLRCRVIGEGGNLGLTQRARVEFALAGGKVNTDAWDNSAGVNCSDHEVNIKILLNSATADGSLTDDQRDQLLAAMTPDVADLVLTDNRRHNDLLGVARHESVLLAAVYQRVITDLETRALDRAVEALPSDVDLTARLESSGRGLASPELAVVAAHVKLDLKMALLKTDLVTDSHFDTALAEYFPKALRDMGDTYLANHPLRREIVATQLANRIVDFAGITFVHRLREETGATAADAARAFEIVSTVFGLDAIWQRIADADIDTTVSDALTHESRRVLDRASRWLLINRPQPLDIRAEIGRFAQPVATLRSHVVDWLHPYDRANLAERSAPALRAGAPEELTADVYGLLDQFCLLDAVEAAERGAVNSSSAAAEIYSPATVAELYFALKEHLGVSRLLMAVSQLDHGDRWHTLARLALREDLYASIRALAVEVLAVTPTGMPTIDRLTDWEGGNTARMSRARSTLAELADSPIDLATMSVAARQVRSMVSLAM